jgi:hypothetical protein
MIGSVAERVGSVSLADGATKTNRTVVGRNIEMSILKTL